MFLVGATIVGVEGKFGILSFLKTLKANFNDFFLAKRFCFTKKGGGMGGRAAWLLCPIPLVRGPCLLIYSIFILSIFLCKYNCKIDHKGIIIGNYTKLTNKQKNHLPGLEAKRYKRLRKIIANAGEFTG